MTNQRSAYKFAFFGTPHIAVSALGHLRTAGLIPTLIITAPPKPRGRGMQLAPTPVAVYAATHSIEHVEPVKITEAEIASLTARSSWDFFVVVAYGKILPQSLLDIVGGKVLNIHPSLLPKYRGPSPLESVLRSDDTETGVTLMQLDAEVDHGPIVAQQAHEIPADMTREVLSEMSAQLGSELIARHIDAYVDGSLKPSEQLHAEATFTKKIFKSDGNLDALATDWDKWKCFRALAGAYPVFFTTVRRGMDLKVKVTKACYREEQFIIEEVIPESKHALSWDAFTAWLAS